MISFFLYYYRSIFFKEMLSLFFNNNFNFFIKKLLYQLENAILSILFGNKSIISLQILNYSANG